MAKRKIKTFKSELGLKAAVIYFDSEHQEFIVKFWVIGSSAATLVYIEEADYFTNCKADAIDTAKHYTGL